MPRPSWPMSDIADLALRCLRHPHDPQLLADVEHAIARGNAETDPSEAGRRYREAVLLADALTMARGTV